MQERVMNLMKKGAISCGEETSIKEVAQILAVNSTRYCVVTNKEHEVLGIISARSILKAFGKDLDHTSAKEILLPHTYTISPNTPLSEAIRLMNRRKRETRARSRNTSRPMEGRERSTSRCNARMFCTRWRSCNETEWISCACPTPTTRR